MTSFSAITGEAASNVAAATAPNSETLCFMSCSSFFIYFGDKKGSRCEGGPLFTLVWW